MKSYINYVTVYNENMELRTVNLFDGLNIIRGESKTGKSALVEIMDYCLCSKNCTVPKGRIFDFAKYYSLIITIEDTRYLIIRETPKIGGKMFFVNVAESFTPDKLTFESISAFSFKTDKQVQSEIEIALGLTVKNFVTNDDKSKKASLRNMVSFMFQHQNLIANKFALFYRFNDVYKRKDTLDQFPIMAGILNQEYYSLLIEKNSLNYRLKTLYKSRKNADKSKKYIIEKIKPLVEDYYSLLGLEITLIDSSKDLLKQCRNLKEADLKEYVQDAATFDRLNKLKDEYHTLQEEERKLNLYINNLEETNKNGAKYIQSMSEISAKASFKLLNNSCKDGVCPLCNQQVSHKIDLLEDVVEELNNEHKVMDVEIEKFYEEKRKLNEQLDDVVHKIKYVYKQIKDLEKQCFSNNDKKEKIESLKNKIETYVDLVDNKFLDLSDDDEVELLKRISELNAELQKFDYDKKRQKAMKFINENMNIIANKLDFEDDYKPIDLFFNVEDSEFQFFLKKDNEKIFLEEMGSGANWVSCHLALFLSLMMYFCSEKKSCIIKTLFFDQPTQVYYGDDNNITDKKAVSNIYKVISDTIDTVNKTSGFKPQIIIVDHAKEDGYDECVRANWFDNKAFI